MKNPGMPQNYEIVYELHEQGKEPIIVWSIKKTSGKASPDFCNLS